MSDEMPYSSDVELSDAGPLSKIPIEVLVCVGRARPQVRDLLQMRADSVLPLDCETDDPVELYVGTRLIARGELEEGEKKGQLSVRLTEVADLAKGL